MNAYCHADATEQASWFGDDIGFKADGFESLGMNTAQIGRIPGAPAGSHGSAVQRGRRLAAFPLSGQQLMLEFLTTHSALGAAVRRADRARTARSARRSARPTSSGTARASPTSCRGARSACRPGWCSSPVRSRCSAAGTASRQRRSMVRRNRGHRVRPGAGRPVLRARRRACWTVSTRPRPGTRSWPPSRSRRARVDGAELDAVLEAMADLADLKSPYLAGHSRGVANLAEEAARPCRACPSTTRTTVRRAALLHDLGRLGVSNAIWDKPGRLDRGRAGAGAAASVPDRPDARAGDRAGRGRDDRRPPSRAAGRLGLSAAD